MLQKRNIKPGKINLIYLNFFFLVFILFSYNLNANESIKTTHTNIKVLDKISSKNTLVILKNGIEVKHKDLLIKSMKCVNSEFDDNPEIMAYIQVKDLTSKDNDDVFVFNGWMFSSSPSIAPFDHPVYDIWLVKCY
tara:strand:- start:336 stop:743 length:408 start_codon:yes stop_codon:yes gene_type:complete